MTEITALVRLSDIVGYQGEVQYAYKSLIGGLESGRITTTLPNWKSVACMQEAVNANSDGIYHKLAAFQRYQSESERPLFDEALYLRGMFLDAMVSLAVQHALHLGELLPILIEKATIEETYGRPMGMSTDDIIGKYMKASGMRKITTKSGAIATVRRSSQGKSFIEIGCLETMLRRQLASIQTQRPIAERVVATFAAYYNQAIE